MKLIHLKDGIHPEEIDEQQKLIMHRYRHPPDDNYQLEILMGQSHIVRLSYAECVNLRNELTLFLPIMRRIKTR
ncbi:hypothetical protein [Endozoicomonas ascidiicola]|uniref:hypothetical protein n=1 Tax=Endozoicomonas ascidiicola TaxID=1698521 RepID=UPI00083699F7|nr:hypothetical protein [Endozoicomonas ascidiicola]